MAIRMHNVADCFLPNVTAAALVQIEENISKSPFCKEILNLRICVFEYLM